MVIQKSNFKFRMFLFIFILTVIINCFNFAGLDLDIMGFLDTYHAIRLKSPNDFLSSRTRLRMEMKTGTNHALAFVSFDLTHNNILRSQPVLELREAYLEYASDTWDFRIGRQIIIWGKADGLQVTDIISPLDLTEFLARDYEDIRSAVDALKFRVLGDKINFQLVWVPFFKAAIIPSGDNPWSFSPPLDNNENLQLIFLDPIQPEKKIGNSEWFGKISLYLPGIDLAFSAFHTWDDFGVTHYFLDLQSGIKRLELQQEYYRVSGFGAEFSLPRGEFVLRGETALYFNKQFEADDPGGGIFKKNNINCLLGIDWYPGNDWILSAQLMDNIILDYESPIKNDHHTFTTTFMIEKKLMHQILTISNFLYLGLNEMDFFNRLSADYALTDELHIIIGIDLFGGDKGLFGQFKDNQEVFASVKYNF
ncbi:MAG: hypothetical protein JSV88_28020 [Candidatus Aminicenantes bacterium]|nr:MAG: hypothetical protein JSV88_28020 [Candidatus Aminicenantes bacterium]